MKKIFASSALKSPRRRLCGLRHGADPADQPRRPPPTAGAAPIQRTPPPPQRRLLLAPRRARIARTGFPAAASPSAPATAISTAVTAAAAADPRNCRRRHHRRRAVATPIRRCVDDTYPAPNAWPPAPTPLRPERHHLRVGAANLGRRNGIEWCDASATARSIRRPEPIAAMTASITSACRAKVPKSGSMRRETRSPDGSAVRVSCGHVRKGFVRRSSPNWPHLVRGRR